jgi:endonuclease/exonuclease/phosphatase family metal-dependent hydrolase
MKLPSIAITRRRAVIVLAGAIFPVLANSAPETTKSIAPLRVLTYNILASQPDWEKDARCEPWGKRMPLIFEVMENPAGGVPYDFIGTQETSTHSEVGLHQARQLAAKLSGYDSLYLPVNGRGRKDEFSLTNMIFWRKDRWKIDRQDSGAFWLSDTPDVPGSNTWSPVDQKTGAPTNKGGRRNVTYGLFHEIINGKRTGKKVYFFNTHLNVAVPDARMKSALLMMERIQNRKDQSAPVILTGDFNSRRDSIVYQFLTGHPVEFEGASHGPPEVLTEAFATVGPRDKLPSIDFVFSSSGLKPKVAANVDILRDGLRPSDHAPIAAVLDWE